MAERERRWYDHNMLGPGKPMIVMEHLTFAREILPQPKCHNKAAQEIERELQMQLVNHELIGDNKVVPPYYTIYWDIRCKEFDMDFQTTYAQDDTGQKLGYAVEHPIRDLEEDFPKLKPSSYWVDKDKTLAWNAFTEEVIGDILPVVIRNNSLNWFVTPSEKIVKLMGLEDMMYAMADSPETMCELYKFIKDDILRFIRWQEREGLLAPNSGNDYAGAGSYGFTTELSPHEGKVNPGDIWLNLNSQETVGISPEMYGEFVAPSYHDLAEVFGLVYYGCCEPVHNIWQYVSKYPNLRKVSVSPWCDEEIMGGYLRNGRIIYSRKPSPNFVGVGRQLDEDAFSEHITQTLRAANNCRLEFIFRDIYTLSGDISKPGRAVQITRELVEKFW